MVKKALTLYDCKKCLDDGMNVCEEQLLFQNKDPEIYMSKVSKISLNRDDVKKLIQADQISTLAKETTYAF